MGNLTILTTEGRMSISGRFIGIHNPIGALLAKESYFDGLWLSGLEVSASLGLPDTEIVSLSQTVGLCRDIRRVCDLPLLVDGDTGYGDPHNMYLAAKDYISAGVTGICIEDKIYPKRNSFANERQKLEDPILFSEKIRAGKLAAQEFGELTVVARLESLIAGESVDQALKRAKIYEDAGADAILVHDKSANGDAVIEFSEKWHSGTPLIAVPTTYFMRSFDELCSAGYSTVVYANQCMRASINTIKWTLASIRDNGSTKEIEENICKVEEIFGLQSKIVERYKTSQTVLP